VAFALNLPSSTSERAKARFFADPACNFQRSLVRTGSVTSIVFDRACGAASLWHAALFVRSQQSSAARTNSGPGSPDTPTNSVAGVGAARSVRPYNVRAAFVREAAGEVGH
jgi:hypothetical protein